MKHQQYKTSYFRTLMFVQRHVPQNNVLAEGSNLTYKHKSGTPNQSVGPHTVVPTTTRKLRKVCALKKNMHVYECSITLNGILECKWNFKENNIAYIVSFFQILTRPTDVELAKNLCTYACSEPIGQGPVFKQADFCGQ